MDDEKLSGTQKLITKAAAPDLRARIEAESRSWMVQCGRCGYERSVWDTGGVRYKASGTSRQYMQCPKCGKWNWHKVYHPTGGSHTDASSDAPIVAYPRTVPWGFIIRLGLLVLVFAALLVTGILFLVGTLTQPIVTAGDNFMTALKTENYTQAYALCTSNLQKELGNASRIETLSQGNKPAQWSWGSRSIRNDIGFLDGSFTYTDGKAGSVHLVFDKVGSDWKISTFELNPN